GVPCQDRLDRGVEALRIAGRELAARGLERLPVLVHRHDVPERGVHRVVLWLLTTVGKSVGQHALRDGAGPLAQDFAGLRAAAGGEAEPPHRDERIASPVAEPRVTGQNRSALTAAGEIGVGGALQAAAERGAALRLFLAQRRYGFGGSCLTELLLVSVSRERP